jgi:ATP-dependent Lhr-like helicase
MRELLTKLPRVGRSIFRSFPSLRKAQKDAIMPILCGKNLVLVSATGSGKTEAVVAPLAEKAVDYPNCTYCLYICPTRALVNDICSRLSFIFGSIQRDTGHIITVGLRTGDRDDTKRQEVPNFLITTPESLDVMISNKYELIKTAQAIVLDDIHEVYGTPRGLHLKVLLKRLESYCGHGLQRIAMSATIASPESIATWMLDTAEDCSTIVDKAQKNVFYWLKNGKVADVPAIVYEEMRKGYRKILIFANTRKECDDIYKELKVYSAFKDRIFLHYSSLDREIREKTEQSLLLCSRAVCVATSTLELGIDIGDIDLIIMYGPPHSVFSFLQRLGRGNRRTSQSKAILVYRGTLDLLKFMALIELAGDGKLENRRPIDFYSVIVQQIFSIINGSKSYKISEEKLYETLCTVSFLDKDELRGILNTLVQKQYLEHDYRSGFYSPSQKLKNMIISGQIYGNISSRSENLTIRDAAGVIGAIPHQSQLMNGDVILFGGRFWKVIDNEIDGELFVQESPKVDDPTRIKWTGSGFPANREIAEMIRKQMKEVRMLPVELDRFAQERVKEIRKRTADIEEIDKTIVHEETDQHVYYTFSGELVNKIAAILLEEIEKDSHTEVDGIAIYSNSPLDFSQLPDKDGISTFIEQESHKLSRILGPTIFHYMLPPDLSRKEVTSFIGVDEISSLVASLKTKEVRDFELGIRD